MCGIWSLIQLKNKKATPSFDDFYQLKHRGPDNSYFESYGNVTVGFHRLAIINDTFSSNQPFLIEDSMRTIIFVCNGEIYNFKDLIHSYELSSEIENDCMVIPELYWKLTKHGEQDAFMKAVEKDVKGEFAFLLFELDRFFVVELCSNGLIVS
jgi:asparagine synthase (glutamine-hydrolysing)